MLANCAFGVHAQSMVSRATTHLGWLIDDYLRRHSASVGGLAERIGISRQALRQWRVGQLRSLPAKEHLEAAAEQIGCSYSLVLDAALHDVGYRSPGSMEDFATAAVVADFVHDEVLSAEHVSGPQGEQVRASVCGPAIWAVAHRGYSGSRCLDVWAYTDEQTALRAAAELALECGLDEDDRAVDSFEREDYRAVLDLYRRTEPDWTVLEVTSVPFMGDDGEPVATSAVFEPLPDRNDLIGEEFAEIIGMVSPRHAALIAEAADDVAADIRSDADLLGSAAVTGRNRRKLQVLAALPPVTFDQSRLWRYQLAEAADRLADDTRRWGAPIPRCTAEEMVLHLILNRAKAKSSGHTDSESWALLSEVLFQDHDVLVLYDLPPEAVEKYIDGINLHPRRWFTQFGLPFLVPDRPMQGSGAEGGLTATDD